MYILVISNLYIQFLFFFPKVLQNVCGTNYTDICDQFELSDSKLPMILDALKDVSFTAMDGKVFMFDDEQQNDVGYNVYISDVDGNFGKVRNINISSILIGVHISLNKV